MTTRYHPDMTPVEAAYFRFLEKRARMKRVERKKKHMRLRGYALADRPFHTKDNTLGCWLKPPPKSSFHYSAEDVSN